MGFKPLIRPKAVPQSTLSSTKPFVVFRTGSKAAGIVFVPGFTGEVKESWGDFPAYLMKDPALSSWGVFGINYASRRRIDLSGIWEADPNLSILAKYLGSEMKLGPFADLRTIAFVAHSMGGLVVQRALIDDTQLEARTSHLIMFGTPSLGLEKASWGRWFKRQVRDMAVSSPFIVKLRSDWNRRYEKRMPFAVLSLQGDRDEFVQGSSSLGPFAEENCKVVPGDHISIVKPESSEDLSVGAAASAIRGQAEFSFLDSAQVALELKDFALAKAKLLPNFNHLDDAALVALAMALDGLGEGDEALRILDDLYEGGRLNSAEAAGTLAGRIKRRWLLDRLAADLVRAMELYSWGLSEAERIGDHAQAYYHAINLAFLQLMSADATANLTNATAEMCQRALAHCAESEPTNWRLATEGEAALMQGDWSTAASSYQRCVSLSAPRQLVSTRNQALAIAERLRGRPGVDVAVAWFTGVPSSN